MAAAAASGGGGSSSVPPALPIELSSLGFRNREEVFDKANAILQGLWNLRREESQADYVASISDPTIQRTFLNERVTGMLSDN